MEAEAAPIVAELGFTKDDPSAIAAPAPTVTFTGERQGAKIHLACNGEEAKQTHSVLGSHTKAPVSLNSAISIARRTKPFTGVHCCRQVQNTWG